MTTVYGLLLNSGHEVFERLTDCNFDDDELTAEDIAAANEKQWRVVECDTVYYNLTYIQQDVATTLKAESKNRYRMDMVNGGTAETLMNHCEHCGVRQSERKLNAPKDSAAADNYAFAYLTQSDPPHPIEMKAINQPFEATGSCWIGYGKGAIYEGEIDKLLYPAHRPRNG